MTRIVSAVYTNGALKPGEPLGLPEGATVQVSIEETGTPAPPWDHDRALRALNEIVALPTENPHDGDDVARNHDRYLYGDRSKFGLGPGTSK